MPEPRGPPLPPLGVPVLRRAARLRRAVGARAGGERVSCGKMRRVFACGGGGERLPGLRRPRIMLRFLRHPLLPRGG